jgi:hypothetical protein
VSGLKDHVGKTYGNLTVVKSLGTRRLASGQCFQWLQCRCVCGELVECMAQNAVSGKTTSCGCKKRFSIGNRINHPLADHVGKVFGRLTVEKSLGMQGNYQYVQCRCICGGVHQCSMANLHTGNTRSCGCLVQEAGVKCRKDYTGEKFNKLTVLGFSRIYRLKNSSRGQIVRCKCGTIKDVHISALRSGTTKSCGCVMSYQEERIASCLKDNGVKFERQYKIAECRRIHPLPFDFAVWSSGELRLIEYHGIQHYERKKKPRSWESYSFERTQDSDWIKETFCEDHGIPLLVLNSTYPDIESTIEWFLDS